MLFALKGDDKLRKLKDYKPTKFMAKTSYYDEDAADFAVAFIESLCHTKGTWAGKNFELIDWQEQIIRDIFGILKPNGYRQFNTAYVEIPKKQGKSELAAAVALLLTCGDGEERADKGFSFLTEDGPHELARVLVHNGYGKTKEIITELAHRDDFADSVKHLNDKEISKSDGEYFDIRKELVDKAKAISEGEDNEE